MQLARLGFTALWNPDLIVAAVVISALYLYAAGRLKRRGLTPPTIGQRLYFLTGIVLLYVAVGSPLDALSDKFLFSAHMLEH
ncbi:cytochrome c oxidase assembly factor CtaG, partial [mine drainage metagenome]